MDALTNGSMRRRTVRRGRLPEIRPEPPSPSVDGQEAFSRLLRSLWRHRLLVVTMTLAGGLLAAVVGQLIPPTYSAKTLLIVDLHRARTVEESEVATPGPVHYDAENSAIETHIAMMKSDAYLRLMLAAYPGLADESRRGQLAKSWYKCDPARPELERPWGDKPPPSGGYPALNRLRGDVTISHEGTSKIVSVVYRARSPLRAAQAANAFADTYVASVTCRERDAAERALAAVDRQIREVRREIEKANLALGNFRPAPGGDGGQAGLAAVNGQIAALGRRYETLVRQRQRLAGLEQTVRPDIGVVAAAQPPERPSSLRPIFLVPPAMIMFALMGCFIAVVRDRFDRSIREAEGGAQALGLPCFAVVPEIADARPSAVRDLMREEPGARYCNAVRTAFAACVLSGRGTRSCKTVLVTSSVPGEGKTTLAWSLALYAARLEWRVVLLDCGKRSAGAGDESDGTMRDAVDMPEPCAGLDVDRVALSWPAGEPLALFSTPRMHALMRDMEKTYDLVVVDAPCVLDRPEAGILTGWADSVLFAVRRGRTGKDTARAALGLMGRGRDLGADRAVDIGFVLTEQAASRRSFGWRGLARSVVHFAVTSSLIVGFLVASAWIATLS